jgi:uncharacterized protein YcbX
MKELRLSEIWIYPVKSLGGIRLTSSKVMEKGLPHDRRWMLVDENGTFMTQRIHPQMALFKISIRGDQMEVAKKQVANDNPSISFNISDPPVGNLIHAQVWNDAVDVVEVNPEISQWFSSHLNIKCKLVSFPEKNSRPVDPGFQINHEQVSLADAYPFLIIGQSSLDDLNTRLEVKLPMNRFRPNFVFTGGEPYEEDTWREFAIGSNRFVGTKPCARCSVPTINQDTAEKGIEPSLTLSKYRKRENKVYFGQNVIAVDHGEVSVGDKISRQYKKVGSRQ